MNIEEALSSAEAALLAAAGEEQAGLEHRQASIAKFMDALTTIAAELTEQRDQLSTVTVWAAAHVDDVIAARRAIQNYNLAFAARYYDGGEEGAERALEMRSRFEVMCELFRGTEAESRLTVYRDDEFDRELHEAAEQCGLSPPPWVPRSHWWWSWPSAQEG